MIQNCTLVDVRIRSALYWVTYAVQSSILLLRNPFILFTPLPVSGKSVFSWKWLKWDQRIKNAGAYDAEEKIVLIDDILHIAVSFSGCTPYDGIHIKATNIPSILSHNFLRIMHIWLTNIGLNELFLAITTALAAGELTDQLLMLSSVLSLVARRAGRKHIILFVDDILHVADIESRNKLLLMLAAEQDVMQTSFTLRVCFSAINTDYFERAKSISRRALYSTPLPPLDKTVLRGPGTARTSKKRNRHQEAAPWGMYACFGVMCRNNVDVVASYLNETVCKKWIYVASPSIALFVTLFDWIK